MLTWTTKKNDHFSKRMVKNGNFTEFNLIPDPNYANGFKCKDELFVQDIGQPASLLFLGQGCLWVVT